MSANLPPELLTALSNIDPEKLREILARTNGQKPQNSQNSNGRRPPRKMKQKGGDYSVQIMVGPERYQKSGQKPKRGFFRRILDSLSKAITSMLNMSGHIDGSGGKDNEKE